MSDVNPDIGNPYAMRARAAKAKAIADYLTSTEPWNAVPRMELIFFLEQEKRSDWWWQITARSAGVNADETPSPITRAMVIGLLDQPGLAGLTMPDRSEGEPCR